MAFFVLLPITPSSFNLVGNLSVGQAFAQADNVLAVAAKGIAEVIAVTGAIKFDVNGDPIKAITVIQVVNGQHVVVKKVQG